MQLRLFYNGYAVKGTLLVDKRVCIKSSKIWILCYVQNLQSCFAFEWCCNIILWEKSILTLSYSLCLLNPANKILDPLPQTISVGLITPLNKICLFHLSTYKLSFISRFCLDIKIWI